MEDINHDFLGQNAPIGKLLKRIEYLERMILTLSALCGIDPDTLRSTTMNVVPKNHNEPPIKPDDSNDK